MNEEIKNVFEKEIKETEDKIKSCLEEKNKILKELKKLNIELRRKEHAKLIYFGEKSKRLKKVKSGEKEEIKNGDEKNSNS